MSQNRFGWDVDRRRDKVLENRRKQAYILYKKAIQANQKTKLDKMKILVVGQGRAGKT